MPDDTRPIIRGFEHHHGPVDERPLPVLATRPGLKATYQDRRPHVVVFRDLAHVEGGPGLFPLAGAVMRWGFGLVICAGPMDPERAAFMLAFAGRLQRSAAVMTTPERAEAWASFAAAATAPRALRCVTLRPDEPLPKISTARTMGRRK